MLESRIPLVVEIVMKSFLKNNGIAQKQDNLAKNYARKLQPIGLLHNVKTKHLVLLSKLCVLE